MEGTLWKENNAKNSCARVKIESEFSLNALDYADGIVYLIIACAVSTVVVFDGKVKYVTEQSRHSQTHAIDKQKRLNESKISLSQTQTHTQRENCLRKWIK